MTKLKRKDVYKNAIENGIVLYDKNRGKWIYNEKEGRVYFLAAEWEFIRDGIDPMENGYPASSLLEAIEILKDE